MTELTQLSRSVFGMNVLITGAASGMGASTAKLFAAEGANVAVTDFDAEGAQSIAAQIGEAGKSAQAFALDVSDREAINTVVPHIAEQFGGLDIIINNAGISAFHPIDGDEYEAVWSSAISILLTSHQRIIRAGLPYLRASGSPRIVNIASTEALGATAFDSPYCAAKAGIIGLTRALAVELGKEGITVNCICPGPIETAMTAAIPDEQKQIYARRRTALRRYGLAEEVAHITLNACLPASSFMTGVVIPVDGGLTSRNA